MAESFLLEQLERIRKLTERMSQVENRTAELSEELARDRAAVGHNPLHEVRDYRVIRQHEDGSHDSPRSRPHSARDSSSRRRRRR